MHMYIKRKLTLKLLKNGIQIQFVIQIQNSFYAIYVKCDFTILQPLANISEILLLVHIRCFTAFALVFGDWMGVMTHISVAQDYRAG